MFITVPDKRTLPLQVRMTHDEAHPHYTDISLPEHVQTLIMEMKSSTLSDVSLLFPDLIVYAITNLPHCARFGLRSFVNGVLKITTRTRYTTTGPTLMIMSGAWPMTRSSLHT